MRYRKIAGIFVVSLAHLGAAEAGPGDVDERFASMVASIRRADYRGDRPELGRLGELLADMDLKSRRAHQHYWVGFAFWRRGINGLNETPTPTDLVMDLERCEHHQRKALEADPAFEDALGALVSCPGMQVGFALPEMRARLLAEGANSFRRLLAAKAGSRNPRTMWLLSGYEASQRDLPKALATLVRGLELAQEESEIPAEPWTPRWGAPELFMSLSYLLSRPADAQPQTARAYAEAALLLAPEWHYVRAILIPAIEALPRDSSPPKR